MGALGNIGGQGGLGGAQNLLRTTPADDLIEAVSRLNRAAEAARRAGWTIDMRFKDPGPEPNEGSAFHQPMPRFAKLTADLSRKV
jgi:hypothetical protein